MPADSRIPVIFVSFFARITTFRRGNIEGKHRTIYSHVNAVLGHIPFVQIQVDLHRVICRMRLETTLGALNPTLSAISC